MKKQIIGCGLALSLFAGVACSVELVIDITGLKNSTGQILVGIYDDPESFPKKGKSMGNQVLPKITGTTAQVTFNQLPEGRYAVVVVHDEDMNRKLTRDFMMMPEEAFGFSNDVEPFMGPPSFDEASFAVSSTTENRIKITMQHF